MNTKALLLALAAACLTAGSALAHPYDHHRDRSHRYEREWRHHHHHGHRHHDRYHYRHRHHAGGAGRYHDIYVGQRLPSCYWDRGYRVGDWRRHALPRPRHHHHWVRAGDEYVLVSIHSGRVAHVLVRR